MDVLAQHIVGMSLTKKWKVDEAFRLVKRSYNYHDLTYEQFLSVIRYLSGHYADLEERQVYRKIWFDEEEGVFGRKRGSRMIYYLNLGTIPDEADFTVVSEYNNRVLGHLSEPFVEKLTPGDVFVLGGKTYIFKRVRGTRVIVEPAHGKRPTVPSWVGEMLPRSFDLSIAVGEFRELMEEKIGSGTPDDEIIDMLVKEYRVDRNSAISILEYMKEQLAVAGFIPSHRRLLLEEYIDPRGRQNIVFHFPFGRRTNDALSKAYAYVVSKKIRGNVATSLTDNGFMLTLPEGKRIELEEIPALLKSEDLRSILKKAIFNTELFKNRFRHVAARSFMILRRYKGHEISVSRQQLKSQQVLSILKKKFPDFPVLVETYREILEDYMDVQHAEEVLKWIESGDSEVLFLRSGNAPSPFSHSIILVGAEDVVILEDRDALLRELHRRILEKVIERKLERKAKFEAEIVENLYRSRQHLEESAKGETKDDVIVILEHVGPLYLFRERKPSIFERMKIGRDKVIRFARSLLKESKIISIRLPNGESRWISIRDFPMYYKALKRKYKEDKLAKQILKILKEKGEATTNELLKQTGRSYSELRFSLKVLEQNMKICKKDFQEKGKEEIVVWTLVDNHVLEGILEEAKRLDEHTALEELILKMISSNVVITAEEASNLTGRPVEEIRDVLEGLEKKGYIISGYFYPLKEQPQYMLYEDFQFLSNIKKGEGVKIYSTRIVTNYLMKKHRLSNDHKLDGGEEDILKLLEEIGPVWDLKSLAIRMKRFDLKWIKKLMNEKKIFFAKGFRGNRMLMNRKQFELFRDSIYRVGELDSIEKKLLTHLKKAETPLSKKEIAKSIKLEKRKIDEAIKDLEEKGYIGIIYENPLKKTGLRYIYIEEEEGKKGRSTIIDLIYHVVKWYSPIPVFGIKWLTKIPRSEILISLRKLESQGKVSKVFIGDGYSEEFYIATDELDKLQEEYRRYEKGESDKETIIILPPKDPYSIRGITMQAKRSFNIEQAHPIIKNGELIGAAKIKLNKEKIEIQDIELNKRDEKIIEIVKREIYNLLSQITTSQR